MVSDINITETIEDKKSWFNIKKFRIGDNNFDKPEKSLDVKSLDQSTFNDLKSEFKFYEATKIVRRYNNLIKLSEEDEKQNIDYFFYKRDWLSNAPNVVNFTFEFNPFDSVKSIDDLSWFFDQYYPYSKLILTVPNIRLRRRVNKKTFDIISLDNYMKFVDSAFEILNDKNNKPIFVPVSIKMGIRKLSELIEHYLKNEHYFYWFDFEGQPISEMSLGRLRHVFNILKKSENFGRTVSYFTNIRREKLSNSNELTSVASDALCAIAGANLIGVNREPMRYFTPPETQSDTLGKAGKGDSTIRKATPIDPSHKARIFNRDTYYYVKTTDPGLFPKTKYVPINAAKLNAEFKTQSVYFLQNQNIDTLLNEKSMFKDQKAGNMLKELTSKSEDQGLDLTDFV
ncbi:MAG: hypothetical protein ABR962_02800 [Candidatus Bathyarchaeia archaeon]|jgi:hypothetical protein